MHIIDLAGQTRALGQTPGELQDLRTEIEGIRAGDIARPVREIAPIAVRAHSLAIRRLQQLDTLSTSQYAVMKNGHENLAVLAEAASRISVASSLCMYGITGRTDALLYEDSDGTPQTSRQYSPRLSAPTACSPRTFPGAWHPPPPGPRTSPSSPAPSPAPVSPPRPPRVQRRPPLPAPQAA
ncbi:MULTISPECIES: hypothetical protein [unclassified Streptomyces]|uniref:hypothetical protein n=1 Tax=unclassified Streptomyces TaxID=2593676 RepID=UPI002967780F|nr:hypothetical protein [Streptomyces sp. SJL17-1]